MTGAVRTARPSRRRLCRAVAAVALAAAVGACAIEAEDTANPIADGDVPFGLLEPDATTTTVVEAGETVQIYLVFSGRLVAVERQIPRGATNADVLEAVVAGPTDLERSIGVTSALPAGTVISATEGDEVVVVDLGTGFGEVRSGDQLLATAQIVFTLDALPGIDGVRFTLEGETVETRLPDGSTQPDPVTSADFAALEP